MEDQLPSLKKQNLKHGEFAKKSIQDLFTKEMLNTSLIKQFNYCSSIVAINEGNGKFKIVKLPSMAQLSSVNAAQCLDVNGDGFVDLVLAGNEFGFLPQFGRLDASFGHVLLNDGKGNFNWVAPMNSGLQVAGQVRDIKEVKEKGSTYLLFLRNDDYPALYEVNKKSKK